MQRVWAVVDPALHERIARDLAPRQALIADGHHRWATYRRLQAERHAAGDGPGPWDRGLAMLVDSRTSPLRVAAIHRVVDGLTLATALAGAAGLHGRPAGDDLDGALPRCTRRPARTPSSSLTGSPTACSRTPTRPRSLPACRPGGRPGGGRWTPASCTACCWTGLAGPGRRRAGRYLHDSGRRCAPRPRPRRRRC